MEIANFGGSEVQNSKTPEPIDKNLACVITSSDHIGGDSPHAKIQNNRPIGGVAAYAWNITLAWFLVFLSYPIHFCDPRFCSRPETKP